VQLNEPPTLQLRVYDRADRAYGGGFVSATGQAGGSYTFEAAPGDAIGLTYRFDLPPSPSDPLALEAQFGIDAGGARVRIDLGDRLTPPAALPPSDPAKLAGKDERLQIGNLWAVTVSGVEVGQPTGDGQRTVTVKVRAENLTDQPMSFGGTPNDPTGGSRDFYVVDARSRLAYSGSATMPRGSVPPGQSRQLEVRMIAPSEFATAGPYRFSIVVDAARDRYGVFKLP
jgi:hypothetical protein